jgi:dihydrofolate reductase
MLQRAVLKNMIPISAVVAVTPTWGIGNEGTLPWGNILPGDLAYFRRITKSTTDPTKKNAVLMGRRTWLGIPEKNRPLKGRVNIVLTNDQQWAKSNLPDGVFVANSLENALQIIETEPSIRGTIESAIVIGGVQLFEESLRHPWCDTYHLTKLDSDFPCDTHMTKKSAEILDSLSPISSSEAHTENGVSYRYVFRLQ